MNRALFIFLALCTLTVSMVPRHKREGGKKPEICAPQTPCAWSIYTPKIKIIEVNITNTYCICNADTYCVVNEDVSDANAYVYRCRQISEALVLPYS